MIAAVAFRNFKALRNASLLLAPFNLVIGPNGSGKSSLIQAILRLRTLARLPLKVGGAAAERRPEAPEIVFTFGAAEGGLKAMMSCVSDGQCDLLEIMPGTTDAGTDRWPTVREKVLSVRAYLFDYYAMALPAARHEHGALASNGANLAALLNHWQEAHPDAFAQVQSAFLQMMPEYDQISFVSRDGGTVELAVRLGEGQEQVLGENLSQGTLHILALCALAHDPAPPALLCIEEVDRGIHPRLFRQVRDLLYRLSYPQAQNQTRPPVQVITTTHSPYLLDLFRQHPEEVVIAQKHGRTADFTRLSDRPDIDQLLSEGSLGDMWFAGIFGGVPEERL